MGILTLRWQKLLDSPPRLSAVSTGTREANSEWNICCVPRPFPRLKVAASLVVRIQAPIRLWACGVPRALLTQAGSPYWEFPGAPSCYPDLTGNSSKMSQAGRGVSSAACRELGLGVATTPITGCTCALPPSLPSGEAGACAGCGLWGQGSSLWDSCTPAVVCSEEEGPAVVPPLKGTSCLEVPLP